MSPIFIYVANKQKAIIPYFNIDQADNDNPIRKDKQTKTIFTNRNNNTVEQNSI